MKKPPPSITINLGGRQRRLILDFNALSAIEELTGKAIIQGSFGELGVADIRAILYACMQSEPDAPTLEEVGAMLAPGHYPECTDIVLRLMMSDTDPRILAPYVPTASPLVEAAMELAEVGPGDHVFDLGCGDGRVLLAAAKRGAQATGIENNEERLAMARANLAQADVHGLMKPRIHFRQGLIQEAELDKASVVFIYLLTTSNVKIRAKLLADLRPGTRIVSHDFPFPGWTAKDARSIPLEDRAHNLFLYVIPEPEVAPEATAAEPEALDQPEVQETPQEAVGAAIE